MGAGRYREFAKTEAGRERNARVPSKFHREVDFAFGSEPRGLRVGTHQSNARPRDLVALDYLRVGGNKFEPGGLPAEWAVGGTLEKNGSIVYGNESHVFVDGALTYLPTTAE